MGENLVEILEGLRDELSRIPGLASRIDYGDWNVHKNIRNYSADDIFLGTPPHRLNRIANGPINER